MKEKSKQAYKHDRRNSKDTGQLDAGERKADGERNCGMN